ncbi:MAG: NADH-quinone oxidoreductase subunit M, partial [Candidatus Acidiferrales bacterium]
MPFSDTHILSTILFTPLVGALVLFFLPRERPDLQRWIANAFALLGLAVALPLVWRFRSGPAAPQFQFLADRVWIPTLDVHFRVGLDGLSLLLVLLTVLLGAVAILSSWRAVHTRERQYYISLLLLQTALLGIFLSLDFILFYVFWELALVPAYLLIGVWGGERRLHAAIKFFLYTLAGSVVMLLAILAVYHARGTFDIREILSHPFSATDGWRLEKWLFWGFFFAFAIKVPMFPFHTWLPDALTEAPTAASVVLAGALLTTGTYGFLRFSVPMLPHAALHYRGFLVALSLIAILYGALVCLMQQDLKRLIAYSTISQMGFCTLGIFALTPLSFYGGIIQQINLGISSAAFFLLAGILHDRRRSRQISDFGGLAAPMPNFAAIYTIVTLGALGMPLLDGFIGEFSVLRGAYEVHWIWAAFGLLGVILAAAYFLWLYQRIMFGEAANPANSAHETPRDLDAREFATLIPLVLLIVWIGVYPQPIFRALHAPVARLVEAVHPASYRAAPLPVPLA